MALRRRIIKEIESFCQDRPDLFLSSLQVEGYQSAGNDGFFFVQTDDKRSPRMILARNIDNGNAPAIVPYYLIHERPEAQAVSFLLGRGLCNLAEVREVSGRLYSRYSGSHSLTDLPHGNAIQSKIALWVHDCLTQDLDHQAELNRHHLPQGACISFDFGLAFMRHYYPPFYTFELGISDASIRENRDFVLELLTRYAVRARQAESEFIAKVTEAYPTTCRVDLCRYYFRNFGGYLSRRMYRGGFFQKMTQAGYLEREALQFAETMGINGCGLRGGLDLLQALSACRPGKLDLRDLDLSGADLRKADLNGADLRGTALEGANLAKADLRGADLTGTSLFGGQATNVAVE